jgi:transposase, IS30 family
MSYTHLSASERFELHHLRQVEQQSLEAIAQKLQRSRSTISRELKRNQVEPGVYLPDSAQVKMQQRRHAAKPRFAKVSVQILGEIQARLEQYHSPEQLCGQMKRQGLPWVSHETIYQLIYANYQGLGRYRQYLRQGRTYRRRKGTYQKRGGIPGRVGIEQRPPIVEAKTELGHWEGDTVIGGHHAGLLVTLVEKTSKFLLVGLAKDKSVEQVNRVILDLLSCVHLTGRKTLTLDNGREFCGHQTLSATLGVDCFFARPYHSWERGLNEHTNGLLRQFFPKGTNFKLVNPKQLQHVAVLINHRPRKSLDYRTPYEVFSSQFSDSVALHS